MSFILSVIDRTKQIEGLLVQSFGAHGLGLGRKVTSVEERLDLRVVKRIRYIAAIRGKLLHDPDYVFDGNEERFLECCDWVLRSLHAQLDEEYEHGNEECDEGGYYASEYTADEEAYDDTGWVILCDESNGYWTHNPPDGLTDALRKLNGDGKAIRSVSLTHGGDWVVLSDALQDCDYHLSGQPAGTIEELLDEGVQIWSVSLASDGSWVILCDKYGYRYSQGVPEDAVDVLDELWESGQMIQGVSFAHSGGWVALYGRNGFEYRGYIPQDALDELTRLNGEGRRIDSIAFTEWDAWAIICDGGADYRCRGIPYSAEDTLQGLCDEQRIIRAIAL